MYGRANVLVQSRMKKNDLLIYVCTGLTIGISSVAILGYAFDIKPLYIWPGSVGMALPTAFAFIVLSAAVMLLERRK